MSVVRSKRNQADPQFVTTARELKSYTTKQCLKLPKRYTFYGNTDMAATGRQIRDCVVRANSIYPLNQHEAQIRRDYITEAFGAINVLIDYINDVIEDIGLPEKTVTEWMRLVDEEIRLLDGLKKKDRERFKKLPD